MNIAGVQELTKFALAIALTFYSIAIVFNLVKANFSYMSGGAEKYSDALESIVIMSILLGAAYVVYKNPADNLGLPLDVQEGGDAQAWKELAKIVIGIVVGTGYFFIAVKAVWTLFQGQAAHMTGRPFQMSDALIKLGGVIISGILTVFAVRITQQLIDSISRI